MLSLKSSDHTPESPMRLQKYLAHRGVASRREVEEWIKAGSIRVNGQIATLGMKVDPLKDHVIVQGRRIKPGGAMRSSNTFLVHKPKGFLCSNKDPHSNKTIFQLLPPAFRKEKFICAGRLDKESEGLVILTNDGHLAQRIMHPSYGVIKRYEVTLEELFEPERLGALRNGVWDEGEELVPDKVIPLRPGPTRRFEIHLSQGRKREIRRLFAAFGCSVRKLKRIQIGKLALRGLPIGGVLRLSEEELAKIFA